MYLRHYDNDQNGPTLSEGGGGGWHRGLLNRTTEKKYISNRNKNSLKAKNRIQNRLNRFFTS